MNLLLRSKPLLACCPPIRSATPRPQGGRLVLLQGSFLLFLGLGSVSMLTAQEARPSRTLPNLTPEMQPPALAAPFGAAGEPVPSPASTPAPASSDAGPPALPEEIAKLLEPTHASPPAPAEGGSKADQEHARRLALCDALLAQLTSDEDEYYKFQRRLLLLLITQNRLAEMASRLQTFGPSYQAPLSAEVALELFRAGKSAESATIHEQAQKAIALSDTWKVDRAREFLTLLALERGDGNLAQDGFNRMTDESSKANYLSRFHILTPEPAQEQVEAFLAKPPDRASSSQTRLLLHLARQKARQDLPAEAEALFKKAFELTIASKNTQALEDIIEIAEAMAAAGLTNQARKTADAYLVICRKYPADAEWKALSFAKAAKLLHTLGDRAALPSLFAEAEASARATFFLWAPAAWIACSRIALLMDQTAEADRCLAEAANNARAYEHPRGRIMGLAEIALHLLEVARPVPGSLIEALNP